uniref:Uncharacterized protein n=1 Tax=Lates calcarifer TaxID=8187 RepID=A0A4W6FP64_LATCA
SCLVHLSCPVHGSPSKPEATVLAGLHPQTCSSTVISDETLLSNMTTLTRPQPLCLSDLYNYMVDIHKHGVRPLACLCSASNHVFPLDGEWEKPTQKDTVPALLWTIRLLCRLRHMIMGLLKVIFKRLLVKSWKFLLSSLWESL